MEASWSNLHVIVSPAWSNAILPTLRYRLKLSQDAYWKAYEMLLEKLFVLYEQHGAAESELHVWNSVGKTIYLTECLAFNIYRCFFGLRYDGTSTQHVAPRRQSAWGRPQCEHFVVSWTHHGFCRLLASRWQVGRFGS